MGRISETLTLEDRFSSKFMKFISLADRAAGQTSRLQAKIQTAQAEVEALAEAQDKAAVQCRASEAALGKYEKTAESLGQKLNAAQIEFNAMVDEQERMVNAGKRSTKAFATLDARVEKHGTKLRQLKADYAQATRAVESQRKALENDALSAQEAAEATQKAAAAAEKLERAYARQTAFKQIGSALAKPLQVSGKLLKNMVAIGNTRMTGGVMSQFSRLAVSMFSAYRILSAFRNALARAPEEIATPFKIAGQNIKDIFGGAVVSMMKPLQSAIERFNAFLNSDSGSVMISQLSTGFAALGQAAAFLVDLLVSGAQWISDNWSAVAPVLAAVAVVIGANMVASALSAAAAWIAALWPLLLVVAAVTGAIAAARQFGATWEEIGGVVGGVIGSIYAFAMNTLIVPLQNAFAALANFIGNLFNDPVAAVEILFWDIVVTINEWIQSILSGIDWLLNKLSNLPGASKIPGLNKLLDGSSSLASGYQTVVDDVKAKADARKAETGWKEYVAPWEQVDYEKSWDKGSQIGQQVGQTIEMGGLFSSLEGIQSTLLDIDSDTSTINRSVSMSDETLKFLVDMAERRYVNQINLTSQTPVINITGANTGHSEADRRALADALRDVLVEQASAGSNSSTAEAY